MKKVLCLNLSWNVKGNIIYLLDVFTNSWQYKNVNTANFVLAVPLDRDSNLTETA